MRHGLSRDGILQHVLRWVLKLAELGLLFIHGQYSFLYTSRSHHIHFEDLSQHSGSPSDRPVLL